MGWLTHCNQTKAQVRESLRRNYEKPFDNITRKILNEAVDREGHVWYLIEHSESGIVTDYYIVVALFRGKCTYKDDTLAVGPYYYGLSKCIAARYLTLLSGHFGSPIKVSPTTESISAAVDHCLDCEVIRKEYEAGWWKRYVASLQYAEEQSKAFATLKPGDIVQCYSGLARFEQKYNAKGQIVATYIDGEKTGKTFRFKDWTLAKTV